MGYDAMALGEGDLAQLGLDVIRQRMEEAEFPFLSANAYLTGTESLIAQPYAILQVGDRSVAIIGLTGGADIPGIDIREPTDAVRAVVGEIGDRADILILLSHAGLKANRKTAQQVPELDLVISGGGKWITQEAERAERGPVVVQADLSTPAHAGRQIGVGAWTFGSGGELDHYEWQNLPLGPEIADDPEMVEWILGNR